MMSNLISVLRHVCKPLLTAGFVAATAVSAHANLVAPVPSGPFNALVFGDFRSTNADMWGGLIAGGRVELSTYEVNARRNSSFGVWTAGGGLISNGRVNGDVTANMNFASNAGHYEGQRLGTASASALAPLRQHYNGMSSLLAADPNARAAYRDPWTGLVFEGVSSATRHVFNVKAADLPNVRWLDIRNIDADEELIINILGGSAVFTNLDLSDSLGRYRTLLNYVDATMVHFSATSPWADVLAPLATIVGGNGHIQGSVVAAAFDSQIELHMGKANFLSDPALVPLPGSLPLTGLALFALAWVRRREPVKRPSAA